MENDTEYMVYRRLCAYSERVYSSKGWLLCFPEAKFEDMVRKALHHYTPTPITRLVYKERIVKEPASPKLDEVDPDVVAGLVGLGYRVKEATAAATGLTGTIEEKMTAALRKLGG